LGLRLHFAQKGSDVFGGAANDDDLCAFVDAGTRNRFTNARAAAGHDDDMILQSKIHSLSMKLLQRRLT
jgi:hypothetical protein